MKGIKKFLLLMVLIFLISAVINRAQSPFQVEFYKSKGMLTKADLVKKDFGRYKGFEIPANKGEAADFVIYSPSFKPSLVLADEKGSVIKQVPGRDEHTAILSAVFPKSGNYILYLVADESASGEYDFQYAFTNENSLSLAPDADFKTAVSYLAEHAKAYFLFFDNPVDGKDTFYKMKDATDVNLERDGSYSAVFYKGNDMVAAQGIFVELSDKLKECFNSDWEKYTTDWKTEKNIREKYIQFKEKSQEEARIVKLSLYDFSNAKQNYRFSYGVTLVFSKEH